MISPLCADSIERGAANERALLRLYQVRPVWSGVSKAAAIGLPDMTLLHAGPPYRDPRLPSAPVLSSAVLCCIHEGWAQTIEQAQSMIADGRVRLLPAQDFNVVTPLAAVISPSTTLVEVTDGDGSGRRAWSLLGSGQGPQLRFGTQDLAVLPRLAWRDNRLAVVLEQVLAAGPIDLFSLALAGLQHGDDLHARTSGATRALVSLIAPSLAHADDVRQMLEQTPLFFLTLWMAACHLMLDAAAAGGEDKAASLVVSLSGNGEQAGIRLAGAPEHWLTSAAQTPQGPRFKPGTASPMLGDSGVIDAAGFGAQAWAFAEDVAADLKGWLPGSPHAAQPWSIGNHPVFSQLGLPSAIDAAEVRVNTPAPRVAIALIDMDGQHGLLGRGICGLTPAHFGYVAPAELQVNQADAWASLNQAFERYEDALVSNDLTVLDELFWQSPHTVRYGPTEHLYGAQQIQVFRQQRRSTGLQRRICERSLTSFGTDAAVAHIVFRRDGVQRAGRQTQTWMRIEGQWRIVSAHVSWSEL